MRKVVPEKAGSESFQMKKRKRSEASNKRRGKNLDAVKFLDFLDFPFERTQEILLFKIRSIK